MLVKLLYHMAARLALFHARQLYHSFRTALTDVDTAQQRSLDRVLTVIRGSEFAREHGLDHVRTVADLRRAMPVVDYEHYRPYIDRVADGHFKAMFGDGRPPRMFATSSGTTDKPKRIPVTREFEADYRRGWNAFGYRLIRDHYEPRVRAILQSSGRYDVGRTSAGIPYGAITGLIASTQKQIVRRLYVGRPEISHLSASGARQYALMRLGMSRDVGFVIAASPATLIQYARLIDAESEELIRDVRDGTISSRIVPDDAIRGRLESLVRPDPNRAAVLGKLRREQGGLKPRDYWRVGFIGCWTGGSMGHYLDQLSAWWGQAAVCDIGLLASEGRVTLPIDDGVPAGPLDVTSGVFEFIPIEDADAANPETRLPRELEVGRRYVVVLTNTSGLVRYRLDDVVLVRGLLGQAPLLEFLHRAGGVASVAGEKLTENQVIAAIQRSRSTLGQAPFEFMLAPVWGEPPAYRLSYTGQIAPGFLDALDRALCDQNEEYESRRTSNRLGALQHRVVADSAFLCMDRRLLSERGCTPEQFKRPCLAIEPGDDDRLLGLNPTSDPSHRREIGAI